MKTFDDKLADLDAKGRRRSLRLPLGIDLSSNDYLGLSGHPDLRRAAIEALEDGIEIGATGSRLLRGHRDAHAELEVFAADHFNRAGHPVLRQRFSGQLRPDHHPDRPA